MNNDYLKFVGYVLLFLLWAVLVETGHADPDLVSAIKWAIVSLGAYHSITTLQGPAQLTALVQAMQQPGAQPKARSALPVIQPKDEL